jgi:hypothetical protein
MGDLRRYIYISTYRIDELRFQIKPAKGDFTGFGAAGTSVQRGAPDPRGVFYDDIEDVEDHLRKEDKLGEFDAPKKYFRGRMSMFVVEFRKVSPAVLYLTGQTEHTVVALAGPLINKVGISDEDAASEERAAALTDEPEVARVVADAQRRAIADGEVGEEGVSPLEPKPMGHRWEYDVFDTHQRMGFYASELRTRLVEVLAWRDSFTAAEDLVDVLPERKNVLLGKPYWVAQPG